MKTKISTILALLSVAASLASAQGMMGGRIGDNVGSGMMGNVQVTAEEMNQTKQDETEGQEIYDLLKSGQVSCANLTNDRFDLLGDYFMGQTAGDNHAAMNKRMTQMMGEDGERQMHISMGKSYSGCYNASATGYRGMMGRGAPVNYGSGEPDAKYGSRSYGGYGMMGWPGGLGYGMMGLGYGGYWSLWNILWLGFWLLVLVALAFFVYHILKKKAGAGESPLDILDRRYAAGEIAAKEFDEMKKRLEG